MVSVIAHVSDSSMYLQLIKQLFLVILFVIITKVFVMIAHFSGSGTGICYLLNCNPN